MKASGIASRALAVLMVYPAVAAGRGGAQIASAGAASPSLAPLSQLGIPVTAAENRAVSFTNKKSAYFYTQTHRNAHPEHSWFRGLNIAGRRVFNDYRLTVNGIVLDAALSVVVVFPDRLVRTYPNGTVETLQLVDGFDLVGISLTNASGKVDLALSGDRVKRISSADGMDLYLSSDDAVKGTVDYLAVGHSGNRFLIADGPTREAATALLEQGVKNAQLWADQRRTRMESLISGDHFLQTSDPKLTDGLRWITLTTDELITEQRGIGIYAGLPWFNQYWGRDTFISLAGATLVTGQFETARTILMSFAKFQDLDHDSPFYGRVPNIVTPGSLDYHTTDGTPRFIIGLRDYVRYSGDRAIVAELYPNIRASIEGAFAHWTDASGYLVHKDNETWMDARRSTDLASYSPRATRANDVEALWYEQLCAGAEFARIMNDAPSAERWTQAAIRVQKHFARDFVDPKTSHIADHLNADGKADFTLRPNLLFALNMVGDERVSAEALRQTWESLVFPWGVATLDPKDQFFHPYHLAPDHYPKDEAYHNGTVWPWLNGIAMQRMIEHGEVDLAWPLFRNTNQLALERGVVGGLPETMDAYPHPGEPWPRLTGAFLQAWSNAEQLRVWYQYVLGIRPEMERDEILLTPRVPTSLGSVDFHVRVGAGSLHGSVNQAAGKRDYSFHLKDQAAKLTLDVAPYETHTFAASSGDTLTARVDADGLHTRLTSEGGSVKEEVVLPLSQSRRLQKDRSDAEFAGTQFARPGSLNSVPVMHTLLH